MIKNLCKDCFGINQENVVISQGDAKHLASLGHYEVYNDFEEKLAVLVVYGVEREHVKQKENNLKSTIVEFLQRSSHHIRVPVDAVKAVEIIESCGITILGMSASASLALLYAVGDPNERQKFIEHLQEVLPGCSEIVIRLGGLPPLALFNSGTNVETSRKSQGIIIVGCQVLSHMLSEVWCTILLNV
jgi:hypothetical protein